MSFILDGRALSNQLKESMRDKVQTLFFQNGRRPTLAVVLVGNNPDSQIYVRSKIKACEAIGRQPECKSDVTSTMIMGCAIAETTGLYGLIVAILLIFVAPGTFTGILMNAIGK